MHPKHKKKPTAAKDGDSSGVVVVDETDKKRRLFPGLALKDQEWEPIISKDVIMKEVDDMMSHFEGGSKRTRPTSSDDDRLLYKIYSGRVNGLKDFGAFVQLDGVVGRVGGVVHNVKVKVMSVAGDRVSLSMKDVDQMTGRDLTPHLRIKSEAELAREEEERAARGANAIPLNSKGFTDDAPVRSAKKLSSPERWEIKQLIASGIVDASEYPDLDEELHNPTAHVEIEEELDVELRDEEPYFLSGQTKRTLDLSPVKIVKAPEGSLNRAALAGASFAKERREMRQQEVNEQADSEARDFSTPWLDPMSKESDKVFAQDLRGNLRGQKAGEQPKWKDVTFNKATTYGEITNLSIQDQRKNLPIYKLRDQLLEAIN
ncbi:hypothetical protein EUX98_g5133 [Antrodiella citrinella]|uniref:S1 motif domain-containing protein n=1 Tax=Antrodiella citrinella TaxID=2447956 RepID=A0A4S4MS95_9APHY|nr:hypothetical protein EUX98_g5133 [Antrodiella citrinella]